MSNTQSEGSLEYITEIYENGKAELNTTAKDRYNDLFTAERLILGEKLADLEDVNDETS